MTSTSASSRFSAVVCGCCLIGIAATAAATVESSTLLANLSFEQLMQIKAITASKRPEALANTPAAVYVLTDEEIHRVGATRLPEALTDIMMPFGDGRQLIAMLYEHDSRLPIIAMSGHATTDFQKETVKRGARAFVGKPFSAEQLLTTIGDALRPPETTG